MSKEILLVWQGTNEQSSGTITETDDIIVVYLDNKSKWGQMYNENDLIEFSQIYLNKRNSEPRMSNKEIFEYWQSNFKNKKCNHENIQMKSSGIWKCKCGYTHY